MKLPISDRLLACCDFVHKGARVADVGTDHGYLGVHLLTHGIAAQVLSTDINPQPLENARRNAIKYGVADRMRFFLADGLRGVPRDFDVLVCAGMGADTIIGILDDAPWLKTGGYRLVLQCQSKRAELNEWLYEAGWQIENAALAQDGKFIYPVVEARFKPGAELTPGQRYIPPALLNCGSALLESYVKRVKGGLEQAICGILNANSEEEPARLPRLRAALAEIEQMEVLIRGNRSGN